MDKASFGLSPAVLQSSSPAFTCVRVQFDRFSCWVSIASDPHTNWCGLNTQEDFWAHRAKSTQNDEREKLLSVAELFLPQVGSNFTLVAQYLQKTKWGLFPGVLLLLQLAADIQFPFTQPSCSHSSQTYLPCKCKLRNNCVAGRVFLVICLSLTSLATLSQHVSQASHSPVFRT